MYQSMYQTTRYAEAKVIKGAKEQLMSCEENRIRYFERVSASGGTLAGALGGETEARAALEQIFNTARNDGAAIRSPLQQHRAAARTLQLFEEMEKGYGLSRPTHSTQGMRLPRRDAQF